VVGTDAPALDGGWGPSLARTGEAMIDLLSAGCSRRLVVAASLIIVLTPDSGVAAAAEAGTTSEDRSDGIAVEGGIIAASVAVDLAVQTRIGLVVAAGGGGTARGPSVNAYLGYQVPLTAHWSLRPGLRAARAWDKTEGCPERCTFDFLVGELAIRYESASGFLFQGGLPLVAGVPVGATRADMHMQAYTLATGDTLLLTTLLVGHRF